MISPHKIDPGRLVICKFSAGALFYQIALLQDYEIS